MVVSTAPHLRSSYRLWHGFSLPVEDDIGGGFGTRDAYAVPNYVANQLNSAYTIMVTSMVMNLWCILFAIAFFWLLKRHDNKPHIVSTSLWNKRSSLTDSFLELIQPSSSRKKEHWRQWWIYPAIVVVLLCWIGQNVLSIIIPPYINIGNAAPVNPSAIYVPSNEDDRAPADRAQVFSLDVPAVLRAVGSAQVASSDVLAKASISETPLSSSSEDGPNTQISYNYTVTGADMGLQYFPSLLLSVTGACRTEYNWLLSSERDDSLGGYTTDTYAVFGNRSLGTLAISAFDGPAPIAFFYTNPEFPPPSGDDPPKMNRTWAAIISSVDRVSYTAGTDPIYLTEPATSSNQSIADTGYLVKPRRPALSCWQRDEWSFAGRKSSILGLNSSALPGLDLSPAMQLILARYLANPKVVDIGNQLGLSNLLSSTTSLGNIFDAGGSSAFSDLHRVVLAAYIATTNTLTDLTLYPPQGSTPRLTNLATGLDGNVREGVADFVIWSTDITTLSVKALIIIPVLSLVLWLLALGLLTWSPLCTVNSLEAGVLHEALQKVSPEARPVLKGKRESSWFLPSHHPTDAEMRDITATPDEEAARASGASTGVRISAAPAPTATTTVTTDGGGTTVVKEVSAEVHEVKRPDDS